MLHSEGEKWLGLYAVASRGLAPGIHYGLLPCCAGDETAKGAYVVRHIVMECGPRPDFAKREPAFSFRDKINFHAVARPHEVEVGRFAAVEAAFDRLHDYHVLEEAANERVGGYLVGGLDAEEVAYESCFGEVYFGGFYEALAEVLVVWAQGSRYVRRFENRQPFLRGSRRNASTISSSVHYSTFACAKAILKRGFAQYCRKEVRGDMRREGLEVPVGTEPEGEVCTLAVQVKDSAGMLVTLLHSYTVIQK